jgi:hypothetical protein
MTAPEETTLTRVECIAAGVDRYHPRLESVPPIPTAFDRVYGCPVWGRQIAAAYMAAPVVDPRALRVYQVFRDETMHQFEFLTAPTGRGGLGVQVEVQPTDPYPDAVAMTADLRENHRLKVYATASSGNEHPVLTADENDAFRAVHDAFGHAAIGRGFDYDGEEAAWLSHCRMYSTVAWRALTTETRGQNCAMLFACDGAFPKQKAVLLPSQFSDPNSVRLVPSWWKNPATREADMEGDQQGRNQAPPHRLITYLLIAIVLARDQDGWDWPLPHLNWRGQLGRSSLTRHHSCWEHSCFAYVRARESPRQGRPAPAAPCLANWSVSFTAFGGTAWSLVTVSTLPRTSPTARWPLLAGAARPKPA